MALIHTTHGPLDESELARTLTFTENENEFVVAIEYRLKKPLASTVQDPRTGQVTRLVEEAGVLVKRSAHVILKEPSVVADALVGGIG